MEEEDDEDEEEREEKYEEDKLLLVQFFLSIKHFKPLYATHPYKEKNWNVRLCKISFQTAVFFFLYSYHTTQCSLDSPVLVVLSVATNLAWYSVGVVNSKQVLVGAQHKLVVYGNGSFFIFVVYDIIAVLLTVIAKKKSCSCFVDILNASK